VVVCGRCSGATRLSYNWTSSVASLRSSSADPRYFRIAANTLTVGATYNLSVNVSDNRGNWNSARAAMTVIASPLVLRLAGGDRTLGGSQSLSLDASGSSDPDDPSAGAGGGMAFAWSCVKGGDDYGKACDLTSAATAVLSSQASRIVLGRIAPGTYQFSVTGSKDMRTTSTLSVMIYVLRNSPPQVSVTTASIYKVNPSDKLALVGSIVLNTTEIVNPNISISWSVLAGSFTGAGGLGSVALTPLTRIITGSNAGTVVGGVLTVPIPLVIVSGALLPSTTYTIQLNTKNYDGASISAAFARVTLSTNAPPTSGTVSVTPPYGFALMTKFSLYAKNWVDDAEDFPLTYTFR
jgi:hypothetical protein